MASPESEAFIRKSMSYEIGEILGKLRENNVFDFEDRLPIILIDRSRSRVNFVENKLLEVKRFTSLVGSHMPALTYLSRNLSSQNITSEVERNDRIMGAINYGKTSILGNNVKSAEKLLYVRKFTGLLKLLKINYWH